MERGGSPYQRIVADLEHRIRTGRLKPGDRVPSTRGIAAQWGVAIATATKALAELQRRDLVRAVPGVGTVVATDPTADPAPPDTRAGATAPPPARPAPASGTGTGTGTASGSGIAAGTGTGTASGTGTTAGTGKPVRGPDMGARIVETAIRIADAEGLGAVSMRRIGIELGVPTMSLYRWIPSKDELTLRMLDAIFLGPPWPDPAPPGWRAQLEYAARRQWTTYHQHPWMAQVVSLTRPQLAPNGMQFTEWMLRALDGLGLTPLEMLEASLTIVGFGQGIAMAYDFERQAERETGISSDEWMQAQEAQAARIFATGRFPMIERVGAEPDLDVELENLFEFGLAIVLDGIERLIALAARRGKSAPARAGRVSRPAV